MRLADPDHPMLRFMAASAADRAAVLHELLRDGLRYAPEHGPGYATHLPMALAALHGLGAEPAQMRRHFAREAARLVDLDGVQAGEPEVAIEGWAALRGRYGAFALLRAHFATSLARHGRDACLREALPGLVGGFGAAAFHGAIRVAHAVESGHDGELAFALAYWAARWVEMPAPRAATGAFDGPAAWLEALDARLQAGEPRWRPSASLITGRMQQAARTSAYAELGGATGGFAGTVDDLATALALAAAKRYAATRNFTVLHMATGARALRVLGPWLDPREPVPAAAWHGVAAASLSSGGAWMPRPSVGIGATHGRANWDDVRRRACDSADDHVIKLVHAMVQQQRVAPHPAWLEAARVAVENDASAAA